MILIQAGSFNMGIDENVYAQPVHNVQINSNFYVGKTEVTVEQYRTCMNAGQCTAPKDTTSDSYCNWTNNVGSKENRPVNCVNWNQARTFAKWIGWDLLTEAQWEYVATSQGQAFMYPWGNTEPTCQLANHQYFNGLTYSFCVNHPRGATAPVCSIIGGNSERRVIRGGSFIVYAEYLQSTNRLNTGFFGQDYSFGFRVSKYAP